MKPQPKIPQRCVICDNLLINLGYFRCMQCGEVCLIHEDTLPEFKPGSPEGEAVVFDAKSQCCKADIEILDMVATCSPECHGKYVKKLEKQWGKFKKVTDSTTGISYKVPTRAIIENGLKFQDLPKYERWVEEPAN